MNTFGTSGTETASSLNTRCLFSPGVAVRRQHLPAGALRELHEVRLSAEVRQLAALHRFRHGPVPAHPPHQWPALPLPAGLYRRLLRDRGGPLLLRAVQEQRAVPQPGGRLHLRVPGGLHG